MVQPLKQLQLGKQGLTPAFIAQVESFFLKERMVKVTVLRSACRDKAELTAIADQLVLALGPHYDYKIVGFVITLIKFRKPVRART